jgi:integrase
VASLALRAQHLKTLSCPPAARKVVYRDTCCRGLQLEVRASGGRTWYLTSSSPRGKRQQLRLGDAAVLSLSQARSLASRLRAQQLLGQEEAAADAAAPTLQAFVQQQFLPYLQLHKPSWKGDEALLRLHLLPLLGGLRLDQLQRSDVDAVLQRQLSKGLKANSANKAAVLLRYLINCAMEWGVTPIRRNPVGKGCLLNTENQRQRLLNPEEAKRLLEAVDTSRNRDLGAIVRLLLLTGARKRELLDARWDAIDWAQQLWRIPKTKSGKVRYVPLSEAALELLRPRRQHCSEELIFTNPRTGRAFPSLYSEWHQARLQAGLHDLRLHDLRHSFASFLINGGRTLYEVQQLLGHSNGAMTQRYAHLSHDTLREATTAASAALAGAARLSS